MIWQQSKLYKIVSVLQALLIAASIILNYLSHKKMGMMRHLVYNNYLWEKNGIEKYLIMGLVSLVALYIIVKLIYKSKTNFDDIFFIVLIVIAALCSIRMINALKYDYYHQAMICMAISLLQLIKLKNRKA